MLNIKYTSDAMEDGIMKCKMESRRTISLPDNLENAIIRLRQTDEYCRLSYSEILRRLVIAGLDSVDKRDEAR